MLFQKTVNRFLVSAIFFIGSAYSATTLLQAPTATIVAECFNAVKMNQTPQPFLKGDQILYIEVSAVEKDGSTKVVGHAVFNHDEDNMWELEDIMVYDGYERKGIGRKMVLLAEYILKPSALIAMSIPTATGFYLKLGFEYIEAPEELTAEEKEGLILLIKKGITVFKECVEEGVSKELLKKAFEKKMFSLLKISPEDAADFTAFFSTLFDDINTQSSIAWFSFEQIEQELINGIDSPGGTMYKEYPENPSHEIF